MVSGGSGDGGGGCVILYKYRFYGPWGRWGWCLGHVTLYMYRFYGLRGEVVAGDKLLSICTGSVLSGGGGDGVGDMFFIYVPVLCFLGEVGGGVGDMLLYISTGPIVSGAGGDCAGDMLLYMYWFYGFWGRW